MHYLCHATCIFIPVFPFFFIFIAVPAPTPPAPPPALPAALAPLAVARFNAFFLPCPLPVRVFAGRGEKGGSPCLLSGFVNYQVHAQPPQPPPPPFFCSPYTAPFPARSVFLKRAKFSFINALNLPHSTAEGAASRPREGMGGASRQSYIMWVHSNEFRTSFEWAVLCLLTAAPCRARRLATLYLALLQVGNFFSTLAQTVVKLISHFTIRICFV